MGVGVATLPGSVAPFSTRVETPGSPASRSRPRPVGDRYQIEGQLGVGGMCIIYRGTQHGTDRPVAIKVLRAELANIPEIVVRFENEARVTARLRSDHAVAILDAGQLEDGASFIVFEYLDGKDLRCLLDDQGSLPVREAVDYVVQACDALAEAHSLGIIHRDVKPENIVVTRAPDGTALVKVLDFGVAKSALPEGRCITNPGDALGSPQYMPPEQLIDPSSADPRSDIWALGIVLYELLTGSNPFDRRSVPAVSAAILTDRPPTPSELCSEIPRPLDAIVMRCLQKDPAGRFSDVGEFARALAPFGPPHSDTIAARVERILEYTSQHAPRTVSSEPPEDRVTLRAVSIARRPRAVQWARSVPISFMLCLTGVIGVFASTEVKPGWTVRARDSLRNELSPELRPTIDRSPDGARDFALPALAITGGSAVPELETAIPTPPMPRVRRIRRHVVDLESTAATSNADTPGAGADSANEPPPAPTADFARVVPAPASSADPPPAE